MMKKNNNNIRRVPRPLGTTMLALSASNPTSTHSNTKLISHILNHYLSNGLSLNGTPLTLDQLSTHLNIPTSIILKRLSKVTIGLSGLSRNPKDTLDSLFGLMAQLALADRGLIHAQYTALKNSQGDKYQAFVSKEVNVSLKLLLESQKPLMELYKALGGLGGTQINILNQQNNSNRNIIGTEEALNLIEDKGLNTLDLSTKQAKRLYRANNLDGTPEIRATHQTDYERPAAVLVHKAPKSIHTEDTEAEEVE